MKSGQKNKKSLPVFSFAFDGPLPLPLATRFFCFVSAARFAYVSVVSLSSVYRSCLLVLPPALVRARAAALEPGIAYGDRPRGWDFGPIGPGSRMLRPKRPISAQIPIQP